MMSHVTATFESEADLQAALDALERLGIPGDAIRVITPPPPEGAAAEAPGGSMDDVPGEESAAGAALIAGAAVAGMAGLGFAASGSPGAAGAMGYPAGGVLAGAAAGALLSEAFGQLADLNLTPGDAELYRRRLREGATIVVVDTRAAPADAIAAVLRNHHAVDLRGG
jgi:hypothetical protein